MRKAKKLTPNQQEWTKEFKRIKSFLNRKSKEGYRFEFELPDMPKRVTKKAIQDLKDIRPVKLYSNAEKVDYETGEIMPAKEYITQRRKESARKAQETKKAKAQKRQPQYQVEKNEQPTQVKTSKKDKLPESQDQTEADSTNDYETSEYEDYEQFKDLFDTEAQKFTPPPDSVMPGTTSLWEQIEGRIQGLEDYIRPSKGKGYVQDSEFTDIHQIIQKIRKEYEATTDYFEDRGGLEALDEYVEKNWTLFDTAFDVLYYSSDSTEIDNAYSEILYFISGGREMSWTDYAEVETGDFNSFSDWE